MTQKGKVAAEAKNENVVVLEVKIIKVMTPQNNTDRITFVTDKEFETIDFTTGQTITSTMFGINIYNAVNQLRNKCPEIQLADTLAMGAMVNPQLIALILTNAEMKIQREFKSSDEIREYTENETYGKDCWKTTILDCKTNIHPMFMTMIADLIKNKPAVVKTVGVVSNPFNI